VSTPESSVSDRFDVAIAGGGVSGLYTAWRILDDAKRRKIRPPKVAMFEMSERVGGRLLTWLPFGEQAGLRAELGGMRFLSDQTLVWTLLNDVLGFKDSVIPFPVDGPNLRQYLRGDGQLMTTKTPSRRYELSPEDTNKPPGTIMSEILAEVLGTPENRQVIRDKLGPSSTGPTSREQWDLVKPQLTWRGRRLWDLGFWNLMSDVRSPETYAYVTDAFGYFSLASNWNAAEALQFFYLDFRQGVSYHTLTQGYEALPKRLCDQALALGLELRVQARVRRFERAGSAIRFEAAGPDWTGEFEAGRLVLAMPRRALELLCCSPDFDLQGSLKLKQLIQSVTPQPAFKLFLLYAERWWEKPPLGIREGRSVSDMPIRQTYYMHPDKGSAPYGLLMASYDDARAVDYWQGLVPREDEREQGRAELHETLTAFAATDAVEGDEGANAPPPLLHQATPDMLRHAKDQVAILHGVPVDAIPDPLIGAFADWGLDPYGGGWNFWQPQVDVRDAMTQIKAPLGTDVKVNIVGDGYSGDAGWVEGALTATEATLQRHMDLAPPPWLKDCYLGW